jgi:hypothetical protein
LPRLVEQAEVVRAEAIKLRGHPLTDSVLRAVINTTTSSTLDRPNVGGGATRG